MSLFTHLIAFLLFTTLFYASYSVKFSNVNAPLLLQGRNVRLPTESVSDVYISVAERKNALKSTQNIIDKMKGQNPFEKSGFITVNPDYESKMYYLFYESKSTSTPTTPIILWLQGGPGCSSMTGAFVELGPYLVNSNLELVENQYSWNQNAHLLFVDNPVGAGFSSTKSSKGYVNNEDEMADNLYKALLGFLDLYPQLKTNPWIIAGESYAGKYIPAIADKIRKEGYKIPLSHIAIGDGLTHPITQFSAYDEFAYVNGLIPLYDVDQIKAYQNQTVDAIQAKNWQEANHHSNSILSTIGTTDGNLNVYDIRESKDYDFDPVIKYLNLPQVKDLMHTNGVDYSDCDYTSYMHLYEDIPQSVLPLVENLLNEGKVKILFYNGQFDLIITATGTSQLLREAKWKGQQAYINSHRSIWKTKDSSGKSTPAGWLRSTGNLFFLQIQDAGHLSPMNQPRNLQAMIQDFIAGRL